MHKLSTTATTDSSAAVISDRYAHFSGIVERLQVEAQLVSKGAWVIAARVLHAVQGLLRDPVQTGSRGRCCCC